MRLIDADAINYEDICDCCPSIDCGDCPAPVGFEMWIDKQPTAYDPDKIVEQLEERKNKIKDNSFIAFCELKDAIEIVKGGAV